MLIIIISICRLPSLVGVAKHEAVNLVRSDFQQSKLKFWRTYMVSAQLWLLGRDWMV